MKYIKKYKKRKKHLPTLTFGVIFISRNRILKSGV